MNINTQLQISGAGSCSACVCEKESRSESELANSLRDQINSELSGYDAWDLMELIDYSQHFDFLRDSEEYQELCNMYN